MILNFPDVRQRNESSDCGVVCVSGVLKYYGIDFKIPQLMKELCYSDLRYTVPTSFEPFFVHQGFKICSGIMAMSDLVHHTRQGRPIICPVASFVDEVGHYVVVHKVSHGQVWFQDPECGPSKKKAFLFDNHWSSMDTYGVLYDHWGIALWR